MIHNIHLGSLLRLEEYAASICTAEYILTNFSFELPAMSQRMFQVACAQSYSKSCVISILDDSDHGPRSAAITDADADVSARNEGHHVSLARTTT
jgi:hypothetical protein